MASENISVYWVRLRPLNPRKGYKLQRFMAFGLRFEEAKRWYKVSPTVIRFNEENGEDEEINVIDYLGAVRNDNDDPESPLAFDICTKEEAQEMDAAEKKAKEVAARKAENPNPVDLVATEDRRRPSKPLSVDPAGKPKRKPGRPPKAKSQVEASDE